MAAIEKPRAIDEKRAGFKRYKEDVASRGKPFYPYAMFHDTVMSLVVVSVIIGLAIVWRYTTPGNHHTIEAGWLGKLYDARADPGTINFVPRPDWYFYFLFYLLRIFKWPNSVILGTVGIPTICLILLLLLPFLDRRRERRLLRRPVAIVAAVLVVLSMGVLTYKGATAHEALASEVKAMVPTWAARERFANNPVAVAGANAFAVSGCTACHTYLGTGGGLFGARDLGDEGTRKNVQAIEAYVTNPRQFGNTIMPVFKPLGPKTIHEIATFLASSKGPH